MHPPGKQSAPHLLLFPEKIALRGNIQRVATVNLQISHYFAALGDPFGPHYSVDYILCQLVMLSFGDKGDTEMMKESLEIKIIFVCCAQVNILAMLYYL